MVPRYLREIADFFQRPIVENARMLLITGAEIRIAVLYRLRVGCAEICILIELVVQMVVDLFLEDLVHFLLV